MYNMSHLLSDQRTGHAGDANTRAVCLSLYLPGLLCSEYPMHIVYIDVIAAPTRPARIL